MPEGRPGVRLSLSSGCLHHPTPHHKREAEQRAALSLRLAFDEALMLQGLTCLRQCLHFGENPPALRISVRTIMFSPLCLQRVHTPMSSLPCACIWETVQSVLCPHFQLFPKKSGSRLFPGEVESTPLSVCSIVSEPSSGRAVYFPGVQAQIALPLGSLLPSTTCFLHLEVISIFPAHAPVVQNNSVSPPDLSAGTSYGLV